MRIAICGTGQLARMMALAGMARGLSFSFVKSPGEDVRPVEALGPVIEPLPQESVASLFERLGRPQVVTTEKEGIDVPFYADFAQCCDVFPPAEAVWVTQNRLREKTFLNAQGVPTAAFRAADTLEAVAVAARELGYPVIVKTQENGYDGKGQWRLSSEDDLASMQAAEASAPWIVEKRVPFLREVSVVAARSATGELAVYPVAENHHQAGILLTSAVPVEAVPAEWLASVERDIARLMVALNYVGVLSMECFVTETGILANELAPRVHNSGHWTQDAVETSQFEQHLRALLGWPLGDTRLQGAAGMVNLLGVEPSAPSVMQPGLFFHWYGKTLKPLRKLGHINLRASTRQQLDAQLAALLVAVYGEK